MKNHTATNRAINRRYRKHFEIAVTIDCNSIAYKTATATMRTKKDGTEQRHTTYNVLASVASENVNTYTDYCIACIEAIAPAMAYTAVKNVYVKEANPFILELLNGILAHATANTETTDVLIEDISYNLLAYCPEYLTNVFPSDWMKTEVVEFATDTDYATDKARKYIRMLYAKEHIKKEQAVKMLSKIKEIDRQIQLAKDGITTEQKIHSYKMVKDTDGKNHKIACIPYTEFIKTKYGIMLDKFREYHVDNDSIDVIQIAKLALLELVSCGLANSPKDFWMYRNYVYTRVNRYIRRQRTFTANNDLYGKFTETDENGNYTETYKKMKYIDRDIELLERSSVIACVEKCLISLLPKRVNVHNIVLTFRYKYINGYNQSEISKKLNVSETMISKYNKQIDRALNSAQMKDYVRAVYF